MAHIWMANDGSWQQVALDGECMILTQDPAAPLSVKQPANDSRPALVRRQGDDAWVLTAPPTSRVMVNGEPVQTGIRVLADRDEIYIDAARMFFTVQRQMAIETYRAGDRQITCPRDKTPIQDGDLVVRCPSCGILHHQTEELPCWTYSPRCAACDHPTDLDPGEAWTPEGL